MFYSDVSAKPIKHMSDNIAPHMKILNMVIPIIIYEGQSKSNKTRVTAPFRKSVDKQNGKLEQYMQ